MLNLYKLDCDTATHPLALIGPINIVWEACAGLAVVRQTEIFLKKWCQTSVFIGNTMQ